MNFPGNLRYTKDHEWVKIEDNSAVMGITEFAQSELGDVVFVDLPEIGRGVKQKETICVVESTKAASDVYSPISGKIKVVNDSLRTKPELINSAPYEAGWMVRLENFNNAEIDGLMTAEQYEKFVKGS